MAYSEPLASRIRRELIGQKAIVEKKMFGGVGFLLNGNMLVGIWKDLLIARIGPEAGRQALDEPFVREFDITGRPMKGWVMVEPGGLAEPGALASWIDRARQFVSQLPAK
ncbi:MAG: TfoX/Sxy family protein [Pirellulales bacterium]